MDRTEIEEVMGYIEEVIGYIEEARNGLPFGKTRGDLQLASFALEAVLDTLDKQQSDPGDECECDECEVARHEGDLPPHASREKVAEVFPPKPTSVNEEYAELEQLVRDGIKAMDERSDFGCLKFDPITDQPSDYEIRLKAWHIAYDFDFEDAYCEFSATLDAATKLYNFLSGQNEDTK